MKTKIIKKIMAVVLSILTVICTGSLTVTTFAAEGSEIEVDNIKYTVIDGCITKVTVKDNVSLGDYTVPSKIKDLSINSIGSCAFKGVQMKTLTIPENITSIGGNAFAKCGAKTVYFNASNCSTNEYLNNYDSPFENQNPSFNDNVSITKFVFGEKVKSIPAYVCANLFSLETVEFKATVTEIGAYAFYGCIALTDVDMSQLTIINEGAFKNCSSLDRVDVPKAITIDDHAFSGCSNVTTVSFPKVDTIGSCAFKGISIETLTIPENVKSIGGNAFANCGAKTVYFNASNCSMNKYLNNAGSPFENQNPSFNGNASITKFVFGEKVKSIPAYVCANLFSLETVEFKATVTEIGAYAFYGCMALTDVDMSQLTIINEGAFKNCSSLDRVDVPKAITIDDHAFSGCSNVTTVSFPKVDTIGSCAFKGISIETLTIPENVKSIGGNAFANCGAKTVYFNASNCSMNKYLNNAGSPFEDQNPSFNGNASITKFVFGEKVKSIPAYVCANLFSLETVEFKAKIVKIEKNAFYNCSAIEDVFFSGSESEWKKVEILDGNDALINAKIHFNGKAEETKSISVKLDDITLNYKSSASLSPTVKTSGDVQYTVKYSSSNTKVATVDENGKVYGVGQGTAKITCTVTDAEGNIATDTCNVKVNYTWWQWIVKIVLFGWIWYK